MRTLAAPLLAIALTLSVVACQGDVGKQGPPGPQGAGGPPGPAGDIASLDDVATASITEQLQQHLEFNLSVARQGDSERLDNLIHLIIENTQRPAFKERLSSLDREMNRIFEAAAADAPN